MNPSIESLKQAQFQLESLLHKLEKVIVKLKPGSAQASLAHHRIEALHIALNLIEKELLRQA